MEIHQVTSGWFCKLETLTKNGVICFSPVTLVSSGLDLRGGFSESLRIYNVLSNSDSPLKCCFTKSLQSYFSYTCKA